VKFVAVALRRLPATITRTPIPAAFRIPILSARAPLGMANAARAISGMEKMRLT